MRTNSPIALFVAVSMAAFTPINLAAKAPDTQGGGEVSANVDEEASGLAKDYRLAPGDRLIMVVYDQPQLSGQFIIDGGGASCFRWPAPSASQRAHSRRSSTAHPRIDLPTVS